ncbi:unnamed protein product [Rhizophagus irregularis]|nr:unnamed protein product [Rhizophagus irregularis]
MLNSSRSTSLWIAYITSYNRMRITSWVLLKKSERFLQYVLEPVTSSRKFAISIGYYIQNFGNWESYLLKLIHKILQLPTLKSDQNIELWCENYLVLRAITAQTMAPDANQLLNTIIMLASAFYSFLLLNKEKRGNQKVIIIFSFLSSIVQESAEVVNS